MKSNRIYITESQFNRLFEAKDDSFSTDELSNIKTLKGRYDYCVQHLGNPIGRGSSRAVFQIDDETVLKLAINKKGIAQNNQENDGYLQQLGIVPLIKGYNNDDLWLVSEFVLPAKEQDFTETLGISFDTFCRFITASNFYRFGRGECRPSVSLDKDKYVYLVDNNEDLQAFDEYIGDFNPPIGDLQRIANYGLCMRDGYPTIVLLDSGLSEDIYDTYYKR
jgi:hypothetical protein